MNDQEIIENIRNGHQQYFRVLYDKYFEYAIRVATIYLHNRRSLAGDAVQEAFIRVYRSLEQYESKRAFKPWFYTILINECKRVVKKNNQSIAVEEPAAQSLYQDKHNFIEYEMLYTAIQQLEEHNRIAVILKYMHDMKDQDIADTLQENVNTIKSRLYKARLKLKQWLEQHSGGAI